jgi:hypothetical protein
VIKIIKDLILSTDNFQQRWQALDATCDHRAIFGVTYMVMTQYVVDGIVNNYFSDNNAMVNMTIQFASRYIQAFDDYAAGNVRIQLLWQQDLFFYNDWTSIHLIY